ncbi:MAG: acyl dehydratase [Acidimicrobiia bacterium]|nr:acyl dehydratase [Acidimicrobiia bacterium]
MRYFDECNVGDEFRSLRPCRVDADEMNAFARRWDPQPYHLDEAEAEKLVGRIFSSALLTLCISQKLTHECGYFDIAMAAGLGLDEVRMLAPAFADDELSLVTTITEMRESSSRPNMGIMTNSTRLSNQHDETVLTYRLTSLVHNRPAP